MSYSPQAFPRIRYVLCDLFLFLKKKNLYIFASANPMAHVWQFKLLGLVTSTNFRVRLETYSVFFFLAAQTSWNLSADRHPLTLCRFYYGPMQFGTNFDRYFKDVICPTLLVKILNISLYIKKNYFFVNVWCSLTHSATHAVVFRSIWRSVATTCWLQESYRLW